MRQFPVTSVSLAVSDFIAAGLVQILHTRCESRQRPTACRCAAAGKLPDDLVRISVGIEDAADIIHDLQQAFELAADAHVADVRSVRRRGSSVADTESAQVVTPAAHAVEANHADAALIARAEVLRLQAVVGVLRERLADVETHAAGIEAARRVTLRSSSTNSRGHPDGEGTSVLRSLTAFGPVAATVIGAAVVAAALVYLGGQRHARRW